jgi:adenylylsulfate kinase-like enzyme
MKTILTLIGLPGSGKTTLGNMVHKLIDGARINADQVRETISCDLKFTTGNREIQAYRMGALAALSLYEPVQIMSDTPMGSLNKTAIVDFVCPTQRTRDVYEWAIRSQLPYPVRRMTVWMDTITAEQCRFPDTGKLFEPPSGADLIVNGWRTEEKLEDIAKSLAYEIRPDKFGMKKVS